MDKLEQYVALPPVGIVSGGIILAELLTIATIGAGQKENPSGYSKFRKTIDTKLSGKTRFEPKYGPALTYSIPLTSALMYLYIKYKNNTQFYNNLYQEISRNGLNFSSILIKNESVRSDIHSLLPHIFVIFHFGKRIFESLFIHIFSNRAPVQLSELLLGPLIGGYYAFLNLNSLYYQNMVNVSYYNNCQLSFYFGSALFVIGEFGNFLHHWYLRVSRLRGKENGAITDDTGKYVIPQGGLFSLIWTPHYFCELIAWYGIAITSKHLNFYLMAGSYTSYLIGRAIATKEWYIKKFKDRCPNRNAIIPFVV